LAELLNLTRLPSGEAKFKQQLLTMQMGKEFLEKGKSELELQKKMGRERMIIAQGGMEFFWDTTLARDLQSPAGLDFFEKEKIRNKILR
jgi:hypothetical protein